jgi:hypothetical protein
VTKLLPDRLRAMPISGKVTGETRNRDSQQAKTRIYQI